MRRAPDVAELEERQATLVPGFRIARQQIGGAAQPFRRETRLAGFEGLPPCREEHARAIRIVFRVRLDELLGLAQALRSEQRRQLVQATSPRPDRSAAADPRGAASRSLATSAFRDRASPG